MAREADGNEVMADAAAEWMQARVEGAGLRGEEFDEDAW
jgi:hypothetical protein